MSNPSFQRTRPKTHSRASQKFNKFHKVNEHIDTKSLHGIRD
ncbi:hypothetical protein HanPSC8_Chr10g0424041 [Helianthus annuus]|nr:hypothetical protein HanPSC8_Chr10g0424041 [Helianthus annuus]